MTSSAARYTSLGSTLTLSRTLGSFLFPRPSAGWMPFQIVYARELLIA